MEYDFLPLFITEDVYLVREEQVKSEVTASDQTVSEESQPDQKVEEPKVNPTPSIPAQKKEEPKVHGLALWTPPLTKEDKELLVKILQAIKEDFNKAHLMEGIGNYTPHYQKLICFGYGKELELKIGKGIPLFEPTIHASQHILISVSPAELHSDQAQKKRLWEALQKMFL